MIKWVWKFTNDTNFLGAEEDTGRDAQQRVLLMATMMARKPKADFWR